MCELDGYRFLTGEEMSATLRGDVGAPEILTGILVAKNGTPVSPGKIFCAGVVDVRRSPAEQGPCVKIRGGILSGMLWAVPTYRWEALEDVFLRSEVRAGRWPVVDLREEDKRWNS